MKTSKPLRVGVLTRPYAQARQTRAVITLFAPFRLDDPKQLLTDMEMWLEVASVLGEGAVLDEGLAKVAGEVLVAGKCHPLNPPQAASQVRVSVLGQGAAASVDKRIAVFGDRYWLRGSPSEPTPFSEMPVDWSRALAATNSLRTPAGEAPRQLVRVTLASNGCPISKTPPGWCALNRTF
jgi:hypothetical protein